MTPDDLDEALARAAYESTAAVGTYDPPWDKLPADDKEPFRETGALWYASLSRAGFAIVPMEPTEAMENAACGDLCRMIEGRIDDPIICGAIWRAMLKAAQEPQP